MMDIVIPYLQTSSDELRYALRSIEQNVEHDRVFIIGDRPGWIKNVEYIPYHQAYRRYHNVRNIMQLACDNPDISDDFIFTNDDIFIMKPTKHFNYHRGTIEEVAEYFSGRYKTNLLRTKELLEKLGYKDTLCYELHIPTILNKQKKEKASLIRKKHIPENQNIQLRTLYGNLYNLGGRKIKDVKVYDNQQKIPRGHFISTSELTFQGKVGDHIKAHFPNKSRFER